MSNTFDKLSVLDSFIEEVNSYLPEIEANLDRLAQSPGDMDALEETYRRSHTIGGSASMMDFLGLAHVAHGMEDILGDALEGLTTLDEPTTGLLRRSLGRLRLLLEGIRSGGVKQEDVIAEDDADFAQYRAVVQASSPRTGVDGYEEYGLAPGQELSMPFSPQPSPLSMPSPAPSFDEVLASFHSPASGEDVVWPEEPAPLDQRFSDLIPHSPVPAASAFPSEPTRATSSALEELMASTRQTSAPTPAYAPTPQPAPYEYEQVYETTYNQPPPTYEQPFEDLVAAYGGTMDSLQSPASLPVSQDILDQDVQTVDMIDQQGMALINSEISLPQVYTDLQQGSQMIGVQVSSLQQQIAQLRSAMSIIEAQRGEFKGFLDGSKDALDRMEDWAGKAMGLNLRNSPEQVRRYLPLSVMWVSNNRLKKVLDLLHQITSGVEMTEEQMAATLQQLQTTIEICGETLYQMQSETAPVLKQDTGWTPWEVQVSQDTETLHERVTFERHGDPYALRNEIEQKIRADLEREYETHVSPLVVRAELERKIREEVRQEYEAQRRLQESVTGYEDNISIQALEARLRNEIEIQVRQEFLEQITAVGGDANALRQTTPRDTSASSVSNFADRAREATGLAGFSAIPVVEPSQTVQPPAPASSVPITLPTQVQPSAPPTVAATPSSSASSYSAAFSEEAIEIFRLEAEEHLQTISVHVAALEKAPTNRDLIQGIRRATHTLKGAAGMMGFRAIADLCHISEDLLDNIMEGGIAISPAVLSIILDTAEVLDLLITGRGASPDDDEARVQALRVRYTALLGEPSSTVSAVDDDIEIEVDAGDDILEASAPVGNIVAGGQLTDAPAQRGARGDLNVRVRLQRLDELVNLFGELLVNRSVLEERVQRLVRLVSDVSLSSNRLRDVGQKLESRFEAATLPSGRSVSVMPGEGNQGISSLDKRNGRTEPAHLAEFDELELDRYTEFHQLARGLSEGISDMGTLSTEMEAIIRECESIFARENRLSTTFQDRLMKIRLVPLSTMAPRLYRAARAVALKQRKEFDFLLEGEATEVDRTVFEEIAGPLLHIMRNAVNHAIETPEARIQKGKSPAGQIKLSAAYEGNQVVITVRDDGVGLDPEHIRSSAISRGLIRHDQALSEGDIIDLIFRPGFSTAEVLSEESGRGVGLDVVRDSVARLRGAIEVESMPGQGTAFTMKFPTSLAIQNAMMVMVGGHQFAIPTAMVETIGRLDSFKRTTIGGQPAILVRNEPYPLQLLAQYLSLPVGQIDEKAPLLLVNAGGQRVALVVDDVKGRFDIVMKNLGPHLRHVHGIAGGTVLGNGRVVLILELSDLLAARAKRFTGRREGGPAAQGPVRQSVDLSTSRQSIRSGSTSTSHERGKHVLIVDDSPSVRRVVSNMLKQHGWEVQMARDGVEALEMISYETPAAVLLDIEMPRMDGYELTATVRAQEQYKTLPIVVLTSRAASKHQQRALQLGANAYVVKPYQDEELLNILNELVYGAGVR